MTTEQYRLNFEERARKKLTLSKYLEEKFKDKIDEKKVSLY